MSALAAVFGPRPDDVAAIPVMLGLMSSRASGHRKVAAGDGFAVGAASHPWEAGVGGWSGPQICETGEFVVAADASLYYEAELRRSLAPFLDVVLVDHTADLVAAAVSVWWHRFTRHIEGDYAFVVWDKARRSLLLARDFCGRRALHYRVLADGRCIVATSPAAVASFPGTVAQYDLDVIAAAAAGVILDSDRTSYAGIRSVPAGTVLQLQHGAGEPEVVERWPLPAFNPAWSHPPTDDDADELRALLERAVLERLPASGRASVWMSGGWDSTSVFAAGKSAALRLQRPVHLLPVSLTYPPGDPGNEDHFIREIAERWRTDVTWVDIENISPFDEAEQRISMRDDAAVHPFEGPQRALARASTEIGARVALEGHGGDLLFLCSDTFLADHLLLGRWGELAAGWRRRRVRSANAFLRTCVLPLLSRSARDWIQSAFGVRLRGFLEFPVPPWVRPRASLPGDAIPRAEREPNEAVTSYETRVLLTNSFFPRLLSWTYAYAVEEGIQLRSPFYDRRLIEFAASRPVNERQTNGETKVLLRRAMRDLLPESVLARRMTKTGTPAPYSGRQVQKALLTHFLPTFAVPSAGAAPSVRLEEMGIIDRALLVAAIERFAATREHVLGAQLAATLQAERWLAARSGAP